jgi:hypothetical protein
MEGAREQTRKKNQQEWAEILRERQKGQEQFGAMELKQSHQQSINNTVATKQATNIHPRQTLHLPPQQQATRFTSAAAAAVAAAFAARCLAALARLLAADLFDTNMHVWQQACIHEAMLMRPNELRV